MSLKNRVKRIEETHPPAPEPVEVVVRHHVVDVPEEPGGEPVELGTITRHYEGGRLVREERTGDL